MTLCIIEAVALLHQHQRQVKTLEHGGKVVEYVEATKDEVDLAVKLMGVVNGNGLSDLPPQTRRLLDLLDAMVTAATKEAGSERRHHRFTRREARERLQLGNTQLKIHLRRLVDAEYVIVHPTHHGRSVNYELAYNGNGSYGYDDNRSGHGRGSVGPWSGGGRPMVGSPIDGETSFIGDSRGADAENARHGSEVEDRRTVDVGPISQGGS